VFNFKAYQPHLQYETISNLIIVTEAKYSCPA
jgi:hypothetical protein